MCDEKHEYVLSKQLLRSGTSIGANVSETQHGQTKPDFNSKMNIALKEANETEYWIRLLYETSFLDETQYNSIHSDIDEIIFLLISICKSTNESMKK